MIRACIFDLDGTLTNTITAIAHFGNTALNEFGFKTFDEDSYKRFVGDGRTKLIQRMLDAQGLLTDENYEKVCRVYDAGYEADPMYKTAPYDGIAELLRELKSRGIKTAVCSNKPDNVVKDIVRTFFGTDMFDCVRGVKEGGATKPDPECALEISEIMGIPHDECLFIGDTNVDIFTAKNAGMTSVGVLWGFRCEDELKSAGADYIAAAPCDILKVVLKKQ